MRGPLSGFRPRTPPPPTPPQPPRPPRTPSPPPRPVPHEDSSRGRDIWIPVSDGSYVTASGNVCVVRSNFTGSVTVSTDSQGRRTVREVGRRIIKEEIKKAVEEEEQPALPPFTSLMQRSRTPPPRPPLPRSGIGRTPSPRPPPPRWVSPLPQRAESPATLPGDHRE